MRARDIEQHEIVWCGINIRVRFERHWLGVPLSKIYLSHLQIDVVHPAGQQLPITQTGFVSRFVAAEEVDDAGGPVRYVLAWIEDAAKQEGGTGLPAERRPDSSLQEPES